MSANKRLQEQCGLHRCETVRKNAERRNRVKRTGEKGRKREKNNSESGKVEELR